MTAEQIAAELDRLAKDAERLGKAYCLSGDETVQAMSLLVNERWRRLNAEYQLARALGR